MSDHPLLITLQAALRAASSEPEAIAQLRAAARQGLTRASAIDALTAWRAGAPEPLDDRLCAALDVATGWCAPHLRLWIHGEDIDAIERRVRQALPDLRARQHVGTHPGDPTGLWSFGRAGVEVRVESSGGLAPFLVERDDAPSLWGASLEQAIEAVISALPPAAHER